MEFEPDILERPICEEVSKQFYQKRERKEEEE